MNLEQFFTPYECHQTLPGAKVLVLAPHPDDEVFGCGATLAQMAQAGCEIHVIVLTDGVLASEWSHLPPAQAQQKRQDKAQRRRGESIAAAARLGYPAPEFMGWCDGQLLCDGSDEGLPIDERLPIKEAPLAELSDKVKALQPDLILAPSVWEMHRDHRAVAQWALKLMASLGVSTGESARRDVHLAFYEVGVPLPANYLVDTTASQQLLDQAMHCFQSQLEGQAYADQIRGLNRFRSYTLGLTVDCAEAFYLLPAADVSRFDAHHQPSQHSLALLKSERALSDKNSSITMLSAEIAELNKQLAEVNQERAALHHSLEATKATLSWRITAPLRWFRRQLLSKK